MLYYIFFKSCWNRYLSLTTLIINDSISLRITHIQKKGTLQLVEYDYINKYFYIRFENLVYITIFAFISDSVIKFFSFYNKKNTSNSFNKLNVFIIQALKTRVKFHLAGTEGFEPSRTVLETVILPLYYVPNFPFAITL